MDRLKAMELLAHLKGQVFLTHYQAVARLAPQMLVRGSETSASSDG